MATLKIVIPVAGIGKRLRPHTLKTPKVLLKVAGKPIISYLLEELLKVGSGEFVFIVGHLGAEVERFVKEKYNIRAKFVYQQEQLGLGHAVYLSKEFVKAGDEVLIVLGDTVFEFDLGKVVNSDNSVIGVKEVLNPERFGVVELKDNRVCNFVEKPDKFVSNLAIVGIYYIKESAALFQSLEELISAGVKTKGEFQLTDGLQALVEKGYEIGVFPVEGWFDCGKPETLLAANRHLLKDHSNKVQIPDSLVTSPVAIEPNTSIRSSIIGPFASIGKDCKITNAIIRDSIIYDGAVVSNSILETSIIGELEIVEGRCLTQNIQKSRKVKNQQVIQ